MKYPTFETLTKEIYEAELEIEALESKIQFADLKTTYSHEYAAMRSEQEQHRQRILKCQALINDQINAERSEREAG